MIMAADSKKRLMSLDVLRGADMFFIMGGDALFSCLAALPGATILAAIGGQMRHAAWDGFTFYDLIFPLFLFLAGVSFPFSLAKQRGEGKNNWAVSRKVVRRAFVLVLLGMVYNGLLQFDFSTLRVASVLGRIGLAWMLAVLLYIWAGRKVAVIVSAFVLLGYWALLALVPAPDAAGLSSFSMGGSVVGYVDRMLLPGVLHDSVHDPEGILSTFPAAVTALIGILVGDYVKAQRGACGTKSVLLMLLAAAVLLVVGCLWGMVFPINKNLWSSSFVCVAGGCSVALFALFYYVIDVKEWRGCALFFRVIGLNSITIYLAQHFIDFHKLTGAVAGGVLGLFPSSLYAVAYWCAYIAVCWAFLYFLYRNKIFLKV